MVLNDEWRLSPVMRLGSDDVLSFSFDEMSHAYRRFVYKVTHCNAEWEPSELFDIDFIEGFNDVPVAEWENSKNTTVLYTNYSFTIPNEDMSLKLSGNYKVQVFDDESDEDTPVAEFCFSVVEQRVAFSAEVSGNTEIDHNRAHQQVSFTVHHSNYKINDASREIIPVISQNRRGDNVVTALVPTYINMSDNMLQYVYKRELVFKGGNEYRRFELTDPRVPGMNVEHVAYEEPFFHASLYVDEPYSFHANTRDENGRYFINTLEGYGTSIEADYVFVHFTLDAPYREGGKYYLFGDFCNNAFDEDCALVYDDEAHVYRASRLLKLGLYNYSYVWLPEGKEGGAVSVDGDFFDTDNEYIIYIYDRRPELRYDKLIGVGYLNLSINE